MDWTVPLAAADILQSMKADPVGGGASAEGWIRRHEGD
jgi:hypothetical protein